MQFVPFLPHLNLSRELFNIPGDNKTGADHPIREYINKHSKNIWRMMGVSDIFSYYNNP